MTVRRYKIEWVKIESVRTTMTKEIQADHTEIADIAKRGRFTYTVV